LGDVSNTSTCQPAARKVVAASSPPSEPPITTARGFSSDLMLRSFALRNATDK
jgi:hypothetical protein